MPINESKIVWDNAQTKNIVWDDKKPQKSFWELLGEKLAPSERTQGLMQTRIPGMRDPFRMAGGPAVAMGVLDQPQLLGTAAVGAMGKGEFKDLYEKDTRPSDLMGVQNGLAKFGIDVVLDPINIPALRMAKSGLTALKAAKGLKKTEIATKLTKDLAKSSTPLKNVIKKVKKEIPEFKATPEDVSPAKFGKENKGNKQVIESLRNKESEVRAQLKLEKDFNKKGVLQLKAQKYREAAEVAEGKMDKVVPGLKNITDKTLPPPPKGGVRTALEKFVEGDATKETTKSVLRKNRAVKDMESAQAIKHSEKRMQWFDKQSEKSNIQFMKDMQGKGPKDPALKVIAKEYRKRLDATWDMANDVDKVNYLENYWPQLWANPERARNFMNKNLTSSPFFKKKRIYDTIQDGLDSGLKLKTANPEKVVLMREMAGFQHKMNKNILKELKDNDLVKFRFGTGPSSPGFVRLKSKGLDVHLPQGKQGYWEVSEGGAKVIDNFLSPSLWSNPKWYGKVFRGASSVKNAIIATKLGLSGFHLIETGVSSMATQMTKSLKSFGRMNLGRGITDMAQVPIAPLRDLVRGNSLVRSWKTGKYTNELDKFYVEMVQRGGGRMDMGKNWMGGVEGQFKNMVSDFRQMKFGKGLLRVVPAITEGISKPIMSGWVPRLKASSYMNMVEDFVKHNPNVTGLALDKKLAKMWDSVDNRFGQLVYDNLFFNKTAKDLGVFSQISMGWNIGTFREFGGAGIDIAKLLAGKAIGKNANIITDRMLYTLTYTTTFGTLGAIMTKAMTGENPKSYMDYFYPRTGKTNPDGSVERLQMPTMLKEVGASTEAIRKHGAVAGTGVYATHKLQPMISMTADLVLNKDYFGTEIFDENATPEENVKNFAEYFATQGLVPISVSGMIRHKKNTGETSIKPLFGFNPAPKYITNTTMQKDIFDLFGQRMGNRTRSRGEAERTRNKAEIRNLIRGGKVRESQDLFTKYRDAKKLSPSVTYKSIYRSAQSLSDQRAFKSLPAEDQKNLIKRMTEEEKKRYIPFAKGQVINEDRTLMKYYKQGGKK